MHSSRLLVLASLVLPVVLTAQSPPAPATNVLFIYRESVKAGKVPAHNAHETAWARALTAAKSPSHYIAMTSLTGPNEVWYFSAYPTWAAYQKNNEDVAANSVATAIGDRFVGGEADLLSDMRSMTLRPRPELGYGPPADLPHMRFVSVTRISVRPGHTGEFEDARKTVKAAHETAHLSDSYSIWEASAGTAGATFYLFVARKSLAELDEAATIHGAEYLTALGGEEGQKKLAAMQASAVNTQQTDHFSFTPSQSLPPQEWVTGDPEFWKPKASAMKKKTP